MYGRELQHAISRTVCIGQFFRVRIAVIAKSMWKPNKTNIHLLIKEEARGRGEETTHREEILLWFEQRFDPYILVWKHVNRVWRLIFGINVPMLLFEVLLFRLSTDLAVEILEESQRDEEQPDHITLYWQDLEPLKSPIIGAQGARCAFCGCMIWRHHVISPSAACRADLSFQSTALTNASTASKKVSGSVLFRIYREAISSIGRLMFGGAFRMRSSFG